MSGQNWGLTQLKSHVTCVSPHWRLCRVSSEKEGILLVSRLHMMLRHHPGMSTNHFILVQYTLGTGDEVTDFYWLNSHLTLEGVSKRLIRERVAALYQDLGRISQPPSPTTQRNSWGFYLQHLSVRDPHLSRSFWAKEFAILDRLPSYIVSKPPFPFPSTIKFKHDTTINIPNLGDLSRRIGVSIPVFAEAVFALSVGLYWSQREEAASEVALYIKPVQGMFYN